MAWKSQRAWSCQGNGAPERNRSDATIESRKRSISRTIATANSEGSP
jgi:hypothetical protein